jgi:hypothetical protein
MAVTNNTSAMGWLRKSNFVKENEQSPNLVLGRHLCEILLQNKFVE